MSTQERGHAAHKNELTRRRLMQKHWKVTTGTVNKAMDRLKGWWNEREGDMMTAREDEPCISHEQWTTQRHQWRYRARSRRHFHRNRHTVLKTVEEGKALRRWCRSRDSMSYHRQSRLRRVCANVARHNFDERLTEAAKGGRSESS